MLKFLSLLLGLSAYLSRKQWLAASCLWRPYWARPPRRPNCLAVLYLRYLTRPNFRQQPSSYSCLHLRPSISLSWVYFLSLAIIHCSCHPMQSGRKCSSRIVRRLPCLVVKLRLVWRAEAAAQVAAMVEFRVTQRRRLLEVEVQAVLPVAKCLLPRRRSHCQAHRQRLRRSSNSPCSSRLPRLLVLLLPSLPSRPDQILVCNPIRLRQDLCRTFQ